MNALNILSKVTGLSGSKDNCLKKGSSKILENINRCSLWQPVFGEVTPPGLVMKCPPA